MVIFLYPARLAFRALMRWKNDALTRSNFRFELNHAICGCFYLALAERESGIMAIAVGQSYRKWES